MDKWQEYKTYDRWVSVNEGWLKSEYNDYIADKYDWTMPDTYVSFDDFCMGKWQSL